MGRKVYIIGVGMTKFDKPGAKVGDYPDMAKEAVQKALLDASISYKEVQQVCVGYVYGDSTCGQRAVYQLGFTGIPVYNVNNNCSTGSTALMMAKQFIEGGIADCVLALGFEKMERGSLGVKYSDRTNPLDLHMGAMSELRGIAKAPFAPQMFGNAGVEHMEKYGTTQEQFAKIAAKNRKHACNNPYSQFQTECSLDQILQSPKVFGPLTKFQCCPTSDGSASAVLASESFVKNHNLQHQAIEIVAMTMATDTYSTLEDKSCIKIVGYDMSKKAADEAYKIAGISSNDVQVIELHDCFSCNELITYEALGLCPVGQGGKLIDSGNVTYGGKWVVNPSGGLISKGHPLGATGLAQCSELTWQLRHMCGNRQVPNVKYALQHNIGLGGAAVVGIYKIGFPDQFKPYPSNKLNPAVKVYNIEELEGKPSTPKIQEKPPTPSIALKSTVIFNELAKRITPDLIQKVNAIYHFQITADGATHSWAVDLKNGAVNMGAPTSKADCTITMADTDFVDLMTGKLDGQTAFMQGKLKITGNMGLAMKLSMLSQKKASL